MVRREGLEANQEKAYKNEIDKTTAKAMRNSLKSIDMRQSYSFIKAGTDCSPPDLKPALLLLSKLVDSWNNQGEDMPDCS